MNKKIIKVITSIACGAGMIGSIPFIATSCGNKKTSLSYVDSVEKMLDLDPTLFGCPVLPNTTSIDVAKTASEQTAVILTALGDSTKDKENFVKYLLMSQAYVAAISYGTPNESGYVKVKDFSYTLNDFSLDSSSTNSIKCSFKISVRISYDHYEEDNTKDFGSDISYDFTSTQYTKDSGIVIKIADETKKAQKAFIYGLDFTDADPTAGSKIYDYIEVMSTVSANGDYEKTRESGSINILNDLSYGNSEAAKFYTP